MLKQSDGGDADITVVTTNSYKVATEALRGKPRWKNGTDGYFDRLVVTSEIVGNRCRIRIDAKCTGISLRSIRLRSRG
jgi:hypothetical protein